MKRTFTTALILLLGLGAHAQNTSQVVPIDQDSLQVLYSKIDAMDRGYLIKMQEHFRYRNRIEPSLQNEQLLLYVEEKLRTATN